MLGQTVRLLQALQSNTHPAEIALGAVLGLYLGLTPSDQTHLIILVLLFFFLKINRGMALLIFPVAKLIYLAGAWSVADRLGYWLLTLPSLPQGFWSFMTQTPVLALLKLNHTLILGGMVIATIAAIPVFLAVVWAVTAYRATLAEKIGRSNLIKALRGMSLIKWFFDHGNKV